MKFRTALTLALALAAAASTTACTSLPTSGDPHSFAFETSPREPISQFGSGPREDSDPEGLIEDFLRACAAGVYDDFATARLYLTPEASLKWTPGDQVIIFPTEVSPKVQVTEEGDVGSVTVTAETMGTLEAKRTLVESPKTGVASLGFDLAKNEDGQWRIVGLDDGVLLSQSAFNTAFQPVDLYFPSQDGVALVADPRWYPRTPKQATLLVEGLVGGPSPAVAPAVAGNFAEGWSIPLRGVEVVDGSAVVDLAGTPELQDAEKRVLTWAVIQTVRQATTVSSVDVQINRVRQKGPLPEGPDYVVDQLIGVEDGEIVTGSSNDWRVLADETVAGKDPSDPAASPVWEGPIAWIQDGESLAILKSDGVVEVEEVSNPSKPSIDRRGNVWVAVDGKNGRELKVFSPDLEPHTVSLPQEVAGDLLTVEVAPDGARVALLAGSSKGRTLWVGGVSQTSADSAPQVPDLYQEERAHPSTIDVTWHGSTTLEALVSHAEGAEMTVETLPIGGWKEVVSAPEGAVRVTAGRAGGPVYVQAEDGTIYQRSGASWFLVDSGPAEVSFPG